MRRTTLKEASSRIGTLNPSRPIMYNLNTPAGNRIDSIAKLKSAYIFLNNGNQGWYLFEKRVRESQPEAKIQKGNCTEWHLNIEKLWGYLISSERFFNMIKAQGIESYEELIFRATKK